MCTTIGTSHNTLAGLLLEISTRQHARTTPRHHRLDRSPTRRLTPPPWPPGRRTGRHTPTHRSPSKTHPTHTTLRFELRGQANGKVPSPTPNSSRARRSGNAAFHRRCMQVRAWWTTKAVDLCRV